MTPETKGRIINESQIGLFTRESLHSRQVATFNLQEVLFYCKNDGGCPVIAADVGGDKITSQEIVFGEGGIVRRGSPTTIRVTDASQQLAVLYDIDDVARPLGLRVGISMAGVFEGTRIVNSPNLVPLTDLCKGQFDGDLTQIITQAIAADNDAVAGIKGGSMYAASELGYVGDAIYLIVGSGFGGAVMKDGLIFANEPGHVPVSSEFNPFGQDKLCEMWGDPRSVCVESVAAGVAGIEDIWRKKTGKRLPGKAIAQLQDCDPLSKELYENSALLAVNAMVGMALAHGIDPKSAVYICHGGTFKAPGYFEKVKELLRDVLGHDPKIVTDMLTPDLNFCVDGAAVGALLASKA